MQNTVYFRKTLTKQPNIGVVINEWWVCLRSCDALMLKALRISLKKCLKNSKKEDVFSTIIEPSKQSPGIFAWQVTVARVICTRSLRWGCISRYEIRNEVSSSERWWNVVAHTHSDISRPQLVFPVRVSSFIGPWRFNHASSQILCLTECVQN